MIIVKKKSVWLHVLIALAVIGLIVSALPAGRAFAADSAEIGDTQFDRGSVILAVSSADSKAYAGHSISEVLKNVSAGLIAEIGEMLHAELDLEDDSEIAKDGDAAAKNTGTQSGKGEAQSENSGTVLAAPANYSWKADTESLPDAAGIHVSWDPVSGAEGYEYKFHYFWGAGDQYVDTGETAGSGQSFYFQDNADLKMEVRAFRTVNGERIYSEWSGDILPEAEVTKMWNEAIQ